MTQTSIRPIHLPRRQASIIQVGAAAVLAAILCVGAGQAHAQPAPQSGAQGAQQAAMHRMGPGMGMGMGTGMPGMAMPERMLDDVGASAEQKSKLRDIFQAAGNDLRAQHVSNRALHEKMLALMAAPQVDAAAAEALRQQQLVRHDAVSKRMLQAMLDAQAVLTPEQRAKLADRMATRQKTMERHRERHHERRTPEAPKG